MGLLWQIKLATFSTFCFIYAACPCKAPFAIKKLLLYYILASHVIYTDNENITTIKLQFVRITVCKILVHIPFYCIHSLRILLYVFSFPNCLIKSQSLPNMQGLCCQYFWYHMQMNNVLDQCIATVIISGYCSSITLATLTTNNNNWTLPTSIDDDV